MKHAFAKPIIFNEKEYTEIDVEIEDITTLDYEKAERQFKALNPAFSGVIENETGFLKQLMINASKFPSDFFDRLPVSEYIKLKYAVQGFLFSSVVPMNYGNNA